MSHTLVQSALSKAAAAFAAVVAMLVGLAGPAAATPSVATGGSHPATEVTVNCATGTIDVRVVNPTSEPTLVVVDIDGDLRGYGPLDPGDEWNDSFPAVENQIMHIESATGDFVDDVIFDCALPEPAYEVIADCTTGEAHARLTNTGNDVASIGVAYPDVMHMEIDLAPGAQHDWLLVVAPGETVDFDVLSVNESIGHEHFEFTCEAPEEPIVELEPIPAAAPAAAERPPVASDEVVTETLVESAAVAPQVSVDAGDSSHGALLLGLALVGLVAMGGLGFALGRRWDEV